MTSTVGSVMLYFHISCICAGDVGGYNMWLMKKNNKRLAAFVKQFKRLFFIYLTTPHGCSIAVERMANNSRRRRSPK